MHHWKRLLLVAALAATSCTHSPYLVSAQKDPTTTAEMTTKMPPSENSISAAHSLMGASMSASQDSILPNDSPVRADNETTSGSTDSEESWVSDYLDTTTIVLGSILGAILLGNIAGCALLKAGYFKKTKKDHLSSATVVAPPSMIEDGDLMPRFSSTTDLDIARSALDAERNKREYSEAVIARAKPGGLRASEFPNVRDVVQHAEQIRASVVGWTRNACAIGGSNSALPATLQSILIQAFVACTREVKKRLDDRMHHLSKGLGENEPVTLSGDGSMNLDTQFVLYEVLSKNYTTLVPVEGRDTRRLATSILQQCGARSDDVLAKKLVFGDAWPSFEALLKSYVMLFVECALQNPPMTFTDDLGKETTFDPVVHREWAHFAHPPTGNRCSIVFPVITLQMGRHQSAIKNGVVRVDS